MDPRHKTHEQTSVTTPRQSSDKAPSSPLRTYALPTLAASTIASAFWLPSLTIPSLFLLFLAYITRRGTTKKPDYQGPTRRHPLIHDAALLFAGGVAVSIIIVTFHAGYGFEKPFMLFPASAAALLLITDLTTRRQHTTTSSDNHDP